MDDNNNTPGHCGVDSGAMLKAGTVHSIKQEADVPLQFCSEGEIVDGLTNIRSVAVDGRLSKLLKPHQREGVLFMWKQCFVDFESHDEGNEAALDDEGKAKVGGCILAHSMGLGKSFQTIALLHTVMTNKEMVSASGKSLIRKVLLIAPLSTITNWKNEFDMWQKNLSSRVHVCNLNALTSPKERASTIRKWKSGVLLSTEGILKSCIDKSKTLVTALKPDVLVLDEAHTLICTATKRYEMLESIKPRRVIALTGSPFQNNPTEYLQMMKFLRQDILGEMADPKVFRRTYAKPIAAGIASDATKREVFESLNKAQKLYNYFGPHVHRMGANVLEKDLPPIHHVVLNIRQTRMQTKLYRAHKKSVHEANRGKKINFLKFYNALRPINSHPASLLCARDDNDRESKFIDDSDNEDDTFTDNSKDWYASTVETVGKEKVYGVMNGYKIALLLHLLAAANKEGDKVVVFANSLATLNYIEYALSLDWVEQVPSLATSFPEMQGTSWKKYVDYYRIDGSDNSKDRGLYIKEFNEFKAAKVMLLSKAGGIGINLVSANRVVMMDQHFNPTVALQAISRVYRYGQTKPVFVYTMLTQGTMEEKVYGRCVNKTGISFRIVDDKTIERCFTAQELADLSNNHLWVQCDNCSKWRLLMGEVSDENIPDVWQCSMNLTDAENNRCAASEKTQAWYEKRSEGKKGLGGMSDSPMARNDTVLQHLLSVTEEGKAKALVCDHHFHEALMETATVTETLQQAYEELATDDEQKAAAAAAASTASTNENQVSHMPNSLFKSATNVGAALATTAAPDPTKKPSTVQALLSSAFNALNLGASAAAPSNH